MLAIWPLPCRRAAPTPPPGLAMPPPPTLPAAFSAPRTATDESTDLKVFYKCLKALVPPFEETWGREEGSTQKKTAGGGGGGDENEASLEVWAALAGRGEKN